MNTDDTDGFAAANALTERVIGCAMKVHNVLGPGFLEKIYENALAIELRQSGVCIEQQKKLDVYYGEFLVGEYIADIVVDERVLLELKAVRAIDDAHQAQLLSYLKTTGLHLGLILNFGAPRLGIKRMVL